MSYPGRGTGYDGYGRYDPTGRGYATGGYSAPPPSFPPYGYGPSDYYPRHDIPPPAPSLPPFPPPSMPGDPGRVPHPYEASYGDRPAAVNRLGPPVDMPSYDKRSDSYAPSSDASRGRYDSHSNRASRSEDSRTTSRDYGHGSATHSRERERNSTDKSSGSELQQSGINLDALLKDERLKNVLFAGISKATAKLEQSLKGRRDSPENVAFLDSSSRNPSSQLFPSATTTTDQPQPKSILKRKGGGGEDSSNVSDQQSKLSALEQTLQLLRGKSNILESFGGKHDSGSQPGDALKGALSQLASYSDAGDDDALYDKTKSSVKHPASGSHPFWSVNAVPPETETVKREKDTFDIQDKLYEQWRQSINKGNDESGALKKDLPIPQVDPFFQKKIPAQMATVTSQVVQEKSGGDNEELDSTVQNILQSIGFNFDLSKRMQELARQKKKQQDELQTGIVDQSASFLDQAGDLGEEMRSSLFGSEQDKSSIENLIKEARASTQKRQPSYERSSSRDRLPDHRSRERDRLLDRRSRERDFDSDRRSGRNRSPEMNRSSSDRYRDGRRFSPEHLERPRQQTERERSSPVKGDVWNRWDSGRRSDKDVQLFYDKDEERGQRSLSREGSAATPPRGRYLNDPDMGDRKKISDRYPATRPDKGYHISERLRDEPRDEYFYPDDNDYTESPPTMPLLTSLSSRRKDEDLSSGLFPSRKSATQPRITPVENLRVTSRAVHDEDDAESFTESRRVILPAKQEHTFMSKSPVYKRSRSPDGRYLKRSASPLTPPVAKERRLYDRKDDYPEKRPLDDYDYYEKEQRQSFELERKWSPDRRAYPGDRSSLEQRSGTSYMSPKSGRSMERGLRDMPQSERVEEYADHRPSSVGRKEEIRKRSPERLRSPIRNDKETRGKSPDRYTFRFGERRRSKSPVRRRSRSPYRHKSRSRSPDRRRTSPGRRHSPGRDRRRSPVRRRSPEKRKSPIHRKTSDKDKGSKASTTAKSQQNKFKLDRRNQASTEPKVDVSKMSPSERKAYLQKLLEKKETGEQSVAGIVTALEKLASLSAEEKKNVIIKATKASMEEKQKMVQNLTLRSVKVGTLKLELEKLKKEQNETMRKCQRSGLGAEDPALKLLSKTQEAVEKEIQRLSVAELIVNLNTRQGVPGSDVKVKTEELQTSTDKKPGETASDSVKTEDKAKGTPAVKKEAWQSVKVTGESHLPDIGDPAKKEDKSKKDSSSGKSNRSQDSKDSKKPEPQRGKKVYYEYYDSGNHWCKYCNAACNSLDQLFQHCHGKKHFTSIEHEKRPWKDGKKEDKTSSKRFGIAQSRRIKGVEMMFPVAGFYCSLCKVFCGDFKESTDHLKTDSHYDKYMEYVKQNPLYEKKLLLEKATAQAVQKRAENANKNAQPPPPPLPPPPPSKQKDKEKAATAKTSGSKEQPAKIKPVKKQFRAAAEAANAESDDESKDKDKTGDNNDVVDMDLDEQEEEGIPQMKSKVPKMTGKPAGVLPPWTSLSIDSGQSDVAMKTSQEDGNQSLDEFLSIKQDSNAEKKSKLPVVSGSGLDLSDIPFPPLPSGPSPSKSPAAVSTVKTREEYRKEEKRQEDEEKRMMGIDVTAEEEQPLDAIPIPPPSLADVPLPSTPQPQDTTAVRPPKPKTLDTLFAKLSKNVANKSVKGKPKPAAVAAVPAPLETPVSEMEEKIQQEIKEKLAKEKMKMLRQQQRAEQKEKKQEEGYTRKKIIDSSSSEESDYSEDMDSDDETCSTEGASSEAVDQQKAAGDRENEVARPEDDENTGEENNTVSQPPEQVTDVIQSVDVSESVQKPMGEAESMDLKEEKVKETLEEKVEESVDETVTEVSEENLKGHLEEQVKEDMDVIMKEKAEVELKRNNIDKPEELDNKELKIETSQDESVDSNQTTNVSPGTKESMKPPPKGKTPPTTKAKSKVAKGKTAQTEVQNISDLSAFFATGITSVAASATKSPSAAKKKGAVKKAARGGKRTTRSTKSAQNEDAEEDSIGEHFNEDDISSFLGDGMIVLSEVTDEEEEQSREQVNTEDTMTTDESVSKGTNSDKDQEAATPQTEEHTSTQLDTQDSEEALKPLDQSESESSIMDMGESSQEPEETSPSPASSRGRGRGRGKKAASGGRGRGRGRKAATLARAKIEAQLDVSAQGEDDQKAAEEQETSVDEGPVGVPSVSEEAVDQGDVDLNVSFEEEPSPSRQTRSRRGGTAKRSRGRGRQTRSRTRKEEEDVETENEPMQSSSPLPAETQHSVQESDTSDAAAEQLQGTEAVVSSTLPQETQNTVESHHLTHDTTSAVTEQHLENVTVPSQPSDPALGEDLAENNTIRTETLAEDAHTVAQVQDLPETAPAAQESEEMQSAYVAEPEQSINIKPPETDLIQAPSSTHQVDQEPLTGSEEVTDIDMPYLVSEREKNVEEPSPPELISQSQLQQEDSDSDATITEETEDPSSITIMENQCMNTNEALDETDSGSKEPLSLVSPDQNYTEESSDAPLASFVSLPQTGDSSITNVDETEIPVVDSTPASEHGHFSGQRKDLPMSGVVSDMEETVDSVMVSMDEQTDDDLEITAPPTAGLNFGLEEEEDSMEFGIVDMGDKMDSLDE